MFICELLVQCHGVRCQGEGLGVVTLPYLDIALRALDEQLTYLTHIRAMKLQPNSLFLYEAVAARTSLGMLATHLLSWIYKHRAATCVTSWV